MLLVLVSALLVLVNALLVLVTALLVFVSALLVLASALLVPVSACEVAQFGKVCFPFHMQPFRRVPAAIATPILLNGFQPPRVNV